MKLNRLQRLVYNAIQNYPGIQNDEAALVAAVWRIQGWSDENTLEENLKRVAHAESIARRRRELAEMGLITYSDQAQKMREEAFKAERGEKGLHRIMDKILGKES
jgi:hypothetical protein